VIEEVLDVALDGYARQRLLDALHDQHERHQQHGEENDEKDGHTVVIVPQ